jgi:DNA-binding NarL/FixJ family response regulator
LPPSPALQTLAALRHIDPQVRVVLVAADLDGYAAADLFALGDARVLSKPLRLEKLVVTLRKIGGAAGGFYLAPRPAFFYITTSRTSLLV